MNAPIIVGLGEVLWDMLPAGPQLGGAPANFAVACARLGANAAIASAVGNGPLGAEAISLLQAADAQTQFLQCNELPTSKVTICLDTHGHAVYTIEQPVAWDALEWTPEWRHLAATADAVCFGTLAQRCERSRGTIREFVANTRADAVRIFDVNLRDPFWDADALQWGLRAATVLKLNEHELSRVLHACGLKASADQAVAARALLSSAPQLQLVCITLGERGSLLVSRGETVRRAGFAADVCDTVGAGDAFTAAMVTYWLRGAPLSGIAASANRLGSYVVSQSGAMPRFPPALVSELDTLAMQGER